MKLNWSILTNIKRVVKLQGRRIAGTYGRTAKKPQKRIANKASRRLKRLI